MKKFSFLFLALSFLFASCSSTKLINSWSDKENTPQEYNNIGVTALFPQSSSRYITEHNVVDYLNEKGIKAMPTTDVFPMAGQLKGAAKELKDSEAIKKSVVAKVTENNIDALMIITMFDKTKEQRWVNDRGFSMGGTGYYGTPYALGGSYYDYYYYSMGTIMDHGYYTDDVTYFIECNLYDVATEKLIWRAQTKTSNPESIEEESKALAYIVVKQLLGKKVISK
ncbi:hypothetical protein SLH46_01890 [Draconibacterium sp. IB214405]|uniref:hypothetical protein n=1 Tax=Draconibacterium sp. IB214405 TaxID=3097352 RepID=UPI002A103409|nr:hypothetical protein [Draconibacterium sp. IB214405]MDX8337914.1 hypothetical protein [Draconibacterium sp. IB214405]